MPIRPPVRVLSPILMERDRIVEAIRQTIDQTFDAADAGCVMRAGEVDRLVYFFLEGLPLIEDQFNRILGRHGIHSTLSGIFCHQTPKVEPIPNGNAKNQTCELGDILFLVTYGRVLYGSYLGNAFLVQAKEDVRSIAGNLQEHLYENATGFNYVSPRNLAGQQRSLAWCDNALWYWSFDGPWRSPVEWVTAGVRPRPSQNSPRPVPFEIVLGDLICGVRGKRVRRLQANSSDMDWSKIVDDLIRQTALATFRRQNAYVSRGREPLRGEDAVRAVNSTLGPNSPYLIRSSFGKIFSIFDDELAALGQKIESAGREFDEERFKRENEKRFYETDTPPPNLGNERMGNDDDDGGCSFVIMDFSAA